MKKSRDRSLRYNPSTMTGEVTGMTMKFCALNVDI